MDSYPPHDDRNVENPYAPPRSTFTPNERPELAAGSRFTVGDIYQWSWTIFKKRARLCLVIFWGTQLINVAIGFGLGRLLQALAESVRDQTLFAISNILVQFASFVVGFWLTVGQSRAFLKIARGEPVAFEEIFRGGRFLLTTILAGIAFFAVLAFPIVIAVFVITLGLVAVENQLIASFFLFVIVSGLAAVFVVYATARLAMYYYLIIDRDAGVIESLVQSWALSRSEIGTITLVFFVQTAIFLAGLLACVVGLIVALPLLSMLMPVTYLALTGTRSPHVTQRDFNLEDEMWTN